MAEDFEPAVQITIASPKGGVGKSMTTILLAGEFAEAGHKVLVIDTDPQKSTMNWYEASKRSDYPLRNIEAVFLSDVEEIGKRLQKSRGETIVLIDIQGTAYAALSAAVAYADFVIIPTAVHTFDIDQALSLVKHIEVLGGRHRRIPYGILLNKISGIERNTFAFKTAIGRLQAEEVDILESFLSLRPTFGAIATAGSLYEVDASSAAIRDARDQTNALAAEIITKLNESGGR